MILLKRRLRRRDLPGLAGGTALLLAATLLWSAGGQSVRADVGTLPPAAPAAPAAPASPAAPVAPTAEPSRTASPPAPAPATAGRVARSRQAPSVVRPVRLRPPSAAFDPSRLRVPAIDLDARVVPVGAPGGVLGIPQDPDVLGWWRDGARPGSGVGTVLVAGHLDSRRYGRGPLRRAVELRPGDLAEVGGSGAAVTYEVVAVRTYDKSRLPARELFTPRGRPGLVLVTCGGRYRRGEGGWDSNVVVVLVPFAR